MDEKDTKTIIKNIGDKIREVLQISGPEIMKAYQNAGDGSLSLNFTATLKGTSDVVDGNVGLTFTMEKFKIGKPLHIELRQTELPFKGKKQKAETKEQEKIRLKKEEESKVMLANQQKTKGLVAERKQKEGESDIDHKKRNKAIDERLELEAKTEKPVTNKKAAAKKGVGKKVVPIKSETQSQAGATVN